MKARSGEVNNSRTLVRERRPAVIRRTIHERSFVKDSHGTLTNGRSSKRWTRGRSFYERPFVNEVELHKKVNPNVHTQYKERDSIQSVCDWMQNSFHYMKSVKIYSFSHGTLSHRFLRQQFAVSYKTDRNKDVHKIGSRRYRMSMQTTRQKHNECG